MFEGEDILKTAQAHIGERYVLGARAELGNPDYKGPWDCAEFASWCAWQTYRVLFGTTEYGAGPDPFSGAWIEDAHARNVVVGVEEAVRTPGAFLLRRKREGLIGHVAISDGQGGTIEARGARYGVMRGPVNGRLWDHGCHIPGVRYRPNPAVQAPERPAVLKVEHPYRRGAYVEAVQKALRRRSFHPGAVDGIYGRQTARTVANFQAFKGLAPDGIVGPDTAEALGLSWPPKPGELE